MKQLPLCITCQPEDLAQGLFGNVFYHVFQVLPYLHANNIFPAWEIRALHYGEPPTYLTLPGSLDLSYVPPPGPYRTLSLNELRRRHAQILGNDWTDLNRIWKAYFHIPPRITGVALSTLPTGRVLGVHYRGTDKQTTTWDSNPISQDEYLTLICDFLTDRPEFDHIFAATDEFSFVEKLRSSIGLPVLSLGEIDFHMATEQSVSRSDKTDRAVLDCVLLSLCSCLIETSSALPSFAKLFNPDLEIYRCAASKVFSNMPYFPVAHIPVLPAKTPASIDILNRTMEADWTQDRRLKKFHRTFTAAPRWPLNHTLFTVAGKIAATDLMARLVKGYR